MRPLRVSASLSLDHPVSCQHLAAIKYPVWWIWQQLISCWVKLIVYWHWSAVHNTPPTLIMGNVGNQRLSVMMGGPGHRAQRSFVWWTLQQGTWNTMDWMLHCTAAKDPYTKSLWVNFDIFKFIVRGGFSGSVAELKIHHWNKDKHKRVGSCGILYHGALHHPILI